MPSSAKHKNSLGLVSSAAAAVMLGFSSTVLIVIEALNTIGANHAQVASAVAALCFAMALSALVLSAQNKIPIATAWSTPGAVLITSSASGVSYESAIGAFIFAGALIVLTAFVKPMTRAIKKIPTSIASAMLAGVLFNYVLRVPQSFVHEPLNVGLLLVTFFAMRRIYPLLAVPAIILLGIAIAIFSGGLSGNCCNFEIVALEIEHPQFQWQTMLSIGVPLFLITMASQNLAGFAVLKTYGYNPPVASALSITGLFSIIIAFFGAQTINMAAITAALVSGPDTHHDQEQRWKMAIPFAIIYGALGLAAMSFVTLLSAISKDLIAAMAGLALFGPTLHGLVNMLKAEADYDAAALTLFVTVSGITLFGIGSAFWGLVAGLILWLAKRALKP